MSRCITLEPMTPSAFAPFGTIPSRPSEAGRTFITSAAGAGADDDDRRDMWISASAPLVALPATLKVMERHPFSRQTFVPLERTRFLVAVCKADASGLPDTTTLRAFAANETMIVTFGRNVWHHPMRILDGANAFAVAMRLSGRGDDDVFVDLNPSVDVVGMPPASP